MFTQKPTQIIDKCIINMHTKNLLIGSMQATYYLEQKTVLAGGRDRGRDRMVVGFQCLSPLIL